MSAVHDMLPASVLDGCLVKHGYAVVKEWLSVNSCQEVALACPTTGWVPRSPRGAVRQEHLECWVQEPAAIPYLAPLIASLSDAVTKVVVPMWRRE
jgi:hypothetical protein